MAPPSGKPHAHGKRKAGHIGFQSSEIAFIEDEMAALAAEYGLDVDHEVAAHVTKRKEHKKKARLRRHEAGSAAAKTHGAKQTEQDLQPRVRLLAPPRRRTVLRKDFDGDHDLVQKILRNVLPEGVSLAKCDVPGCSCSRGQRELVLNASSDGDDDVMTESDVVRRGACKKCRHSVLQHALVDDDATSRPSGGQRLLGALYQLIRAGRLAGSVFRSRVWVASILRLLEELLVHLRKQITAGGTHNGQKMIKELQHEQIVLAELTVLLKKAEHASQKAVSRDELPIEMANAFDPMYFRVYYACLVVYGRACAAVPPPDEYFSDIETFTPEVHALVETFVNQELVASTGEDDDDDAIPASMFKSLALPVVAAATSNRKKKEQAHGAVGAGSSGISLLDLFHARFREGIRLFYEHSIGMHGEMDALLSNAGGALTSGAVAAPSSASSSMNQPKKKHYRREKDAASASGKDASGPFGATAGTSGLTELPAYEMLAQWRAMCRDWCSFLYSFATPTDEALTVVAKYAPVVEMGAGTGYWMALLAARGVDVMAFDVTLPSQQASRAGGDDDEGDDKSKGAFAHLHRKKAKEEPQRNSAHGEVPTFTSVAKGTPETLTTDEGSHHRSLFLCFPPPSDAMALQSLKSFKGDHVVYVGEWQGDSADRAFEKELVRKFTNVEEVELPNWGNAACSLTVWKRKSKDARRSGETSILARLSCFHCHASLLEATTDDDAEEFKRCVLCKTNVYCSQECSDAHRRAHAAEHAKRLVFLEDVSKLEFANDLHYKPLQALATDGEDGESDSDSESDEKVVVAKANWKALTNAQTPAKSEAKATTSAGFAFNFGS